MTAPTLAASEPVLQAEKPSFDEARPDPKSMGFLVNDVARLLRAGFAAKVSEAGLGLTDGEARALAHAVAASGARQTEIAERMGVEPMTLCGYVDRLESRGLVQRQPHPDDRRAKRIVPTPQAEQALAEIMPLARGVVQHALAGLPEADVAALRRALEHMRERLTDRPRA